MTYVSDFQATYAAALAAYELALAAVSDSGQHDDVEDTVTALVDAAYALGSRSTLPIASDLPE